MKLGSLPGTIAGAWITVERALDAFTLGAASGLVRSPEGSVLVCEGLSEADADAAVAMLQPYLAAERLYATLVSTPAGLSVKLWQHPAGYLQLVA